MAFPVITEVSKASVFLSPWQLPKPPTKTTAQDAEVGRPTPKPLYRMDGPVALTGAPARN